MNFKNYEVPPESRAVIHQFILEDKIDTTFQAMPQSESDRHRVQFRLLRNELSEHVDAQNQLFSSQTAGRDRSSALALLSALPPNATSEQLIQPLFQSKTGLILGEKGHRQASIKFLIENMRVLAQQGVKVLYLDVVFSDLHQAELDAYLRSPIGFFPENLKNYLNFIQPREEKTEQLRASSKENHFYTYIELIEAAKEKKIPVVGISGAAATLAKEGIGDIMVSVSSRVNTQVLYAESVINHYTPPRNPHSGKWIALTEDSNLNQGLGHVGLAELTDAWSLRVQPSHEAALSEDPGFIKLIENGMSYFRLGQHKFVQADYVLHVNSLRGPAVVKEPQRPKSVPGQSSEYFQRPGDFSLNVEKGEIIFLNRQGEHATVSIQQRAGQFYIESDFWPNLSNKRYSGLNALIVDLQRTGAVLKPLLPNMEQLAEEYRRQYQPTASAEASLVQRVSPLSVDRWVPYSVQQLQKYAPNTPQSMLNVGLEEVVVIQVRDTLGARTRAAIEYNKNPTKNTILQFEDDTATYRLIASKGEISQTFGGTLAETELPELQNPKKIKISIAAGSANDHLILRGSADPLAKNLLQLLMNRYPRLQSVNVALLGAFEEGFQQVFERRFAERARGFNGALLLQVSLEGAQKGVLDLSLPWPKQNSFSDQSLYKVSLPILPFSEASDVAPLPLLRMVSPAASPPRPLLLQAPAPVRPPIAALDLTWPGARPLTQVFRLGEEARGALRGPSAGPQDYRFATPTTPRRIRRAVEPGTVADGASAVSSVSGSALPNLAQQTAPSLAVEQLLQTLVHPMMAPTAASAPMKPSAQPPCCLAVLGLDN